MSDHLYRLAYRDESGAFHMTYRVPGPRVYETLAAARNARANIRYGYGGPEKLVIQRIPADDWETVDDPQA